jgi:hypothetical protein
LNDTRLALQKRLLDLVSTNVVEWENTDFNAPSLSTPYYKAFILNSETLNLALDTMDGESRGIFQVTLLFPKDEGTIPLETKAQEIMDYYAGATIIEGNRKVTIMEQSDFDILNSTNDRFVGAVSIPFKSVKI